MRGVMGARKAQTVGFDKAHRTNRLATALRSQALSVVAIGALLATTLVLSHETPAQASTPDTCMVATPTGSGTSASPYRLSTPGHLYWIDELQAFTDDPADKPFDGPTSWRVTRAKDKNRLSGHYVLENDIDLGPCISSQPWQPIGARRLLEVLEPEAYSSYAVASEALEPFSGSFDGQGHRIRGVTIADRDSDRGPTGLFAIVEGVGREVANRAKIHNLIIEGVNFSGISGANTGALAGQIGNAIVENVHVSGTITTSGNNSGGLIGQASEATVAVPAPIDVRSSSSAVAVVSTAGPVGGLIGDIDNRSRGSLVIDSFATGNVEGSSKTGGLIGKLGDSSSGDRTFENRVVRSYATGNVTAASEAGGLVGEAYGVILYSYATGNVTGRDEVGGLAGNFQGNSNRTTPTIKDSYSTGNVVRSEGGSNEARGGGLIGNLRGPGPVIRTYSIGSVTDLGRPDDNSYNLYRDMGGFAGNPSSSLLAWGDGGTPGHEERIVGNFWNKETIGSDGKPENSIGSYPGDTGFPAGTVTPSTTATMTSFDTYHAAGWAIIQGQGEFNGLDGIASGSGNSIVWGTAVPGTHRVWGIDPQLNCGYPFLLWQTEFLQCSAGGSGAASSGSRERQASAPAIHLDLQANVGDRVSGAPVVVGGEGLSAGSTMTLVVRSTPQTLVSGRVSSLGNFSTRASLPALSPGSHTLTLTGTAPDGAVLTLVQGFVVGADGTFTSIGQPTGSQTGGLAATGVPANAGVLFAVSSLMLLAIGLSLLRVRSRHQFTR